MAATPTDDGASASLAQSLRARLATERSRRHLPGFAVAVVRDDARWAAGFGRADVRRGISVTADTRFYLGSLSKSFTTMTVLSLVDEGRLRLDDPVGRHFPELASALAHGGVELTVEHLLTHRTGLPREGGDYWFTGEFPSAAQLIERVQETGLDFTPGTRHRYSNLGYGLLGLLAARVAGQSFDALVLGRILRPLGMGRSGTGERPPGLANGYSPRDGVLPDAAHPFAGLGSRLADGRRERMYHGARAMTPAFGLHSSAADMTAALTAWLDPSRLPLTQSSRARMLRGAEGAPRTLAFRIGRVDGVAVLRHDGWFAAHRSHVLLVPSRHVGVAILTNADDGDPGGLAELVVEALAP